MRFARSLTATATLAMAVLVALAGIPVAAAEAPKLASGDPPDARASTEPGAGEGQGDSELSEAEVLEVEANRLYREGRLNEAIELSERALSLRERELGPDHPGVVDAINALALLYLTADDYAAAEALFQRVLEITTETLGTRDPAVATTLNNLGMLYWEQGDRERAAQFLEKAISIWQDSLGADHPKVAVALNNMASLYLKAGDLGRAEPIYEKALAIWDKTANPSHEQLADTLRKLAAINQRKGEYQRTESFLIRALALEEKTRGEDHAATAVALSNLALHYFDAGDFERAKPLLERALAISERVRGPSSPDVIASLSNLAAVNLALGDSARAVQYYERIVEIREEKRDSDPLSLAGALEKLASIRREQGEYALSLPYYERALAIRVKALGGDDEGIVKTTKDLAVVNWALGDFSSAQPYFERALAIRRDYRNPGDPVIAISVDNLASVYFARREYAKAESLYREALAMRERFFEPEHPAIAHSHRNLGLLYWARTDWEQAERHFARAADIEERQIPLLVPAQPDERARAFMDELTHTTNAILAYQGARPSQESTSRLAFTTVLRRKGRELGVGVDEIGALRRRLSSDERVVFDKIVARRNDLGSLILQKSSRTGSKVIAQRLETLRAELRELEAAAAEESPLLRSGVVPIGIADVQPRISADSALVELVAYRELDPARISTDAASGTAKVAAFVLRANGNPHWVPLGDAEWIAARARAFQEALADADVAPAQLRDLSRELYDRLAAPLEPHLAGIRTVFVAPDPTTALVPLGALLDREGRYYIERYEIVYLTSGRDLLLADSDVPSRGDPLVVAAPDYDAKRPAKRDATRAPRERLAPEISALRFPPLSLSKTGAADVGRLLGVTPLTGSKADDAALLDAHAPRVMHLALDGFLLPDEPVEDAPRWSSILNVDSSLRPLAAASPLIRGGLALAGVNRRASDDDGGLLLSREIAELDLWGTKLVGLEIRGIVSERAAANRSAYALRRAWMIAGAASQLANLWTTDASAAAELTAAFYERVLDGEGRSEALRNVQLEMLRSESRSRPFYWASFVLIGASGPIVATGSPVAAQ